MDYSNYFLCCDNFFSKNTCDRYIRFYNEHYNKSYAYIDTRPLKIDVDENINSIIKKFDIKFYLDNLEIVQRKSGSVMEDHIDTGDSLSFILYLNDDYFGGETVLEDTVTIIPKTGRLLIFTNGTIPHRVNVIKSGVRYVIAGWFV